MKERVKDSMYALGLPIVQGAISTILGVIGLALAPSYIFLTFFKMVLLVIVLGALHGLILLPVLLSFLGPGTCCGLQTSQNGEKVKKKTKNLSHNKQQLQQQTTQTYMHTEVPAEMSMKIPRPKHCSRPSCPSQQSTVPVGQSVMPNADETTTAGGFHSDNYLQAATKNKKSSRTTSSNHATSSSNNGAGIKLHEMYTNRAFKD